MATRFLSSTFLGLVTMTTLITASCIAPPPPEPEPITVFELRLPPVSADNSTGACSSELNPHRTGCIVKIGRPGSPLGPGAVASGDFLPDNKHVITMVTFVGAPAAPDPASIYDGVHVIISKVDKGETFPSGDAWKCLTCGGPENQRAGMSAELDYPQSFHDGKRVLAGHSIIDCGEYDLASAECNPDRTFVYPIRWETTAEGSSDKDAEGGDMRELRIHPDNVHLGWISFTSTGGVIGQNAYFGRLVFNPAPASGSPRVPRYDVHNVTVMRNANGVQQFSVEGDEIFVNDDAILVGELRGFTGRGGRATYVGSAREASNIDAFTVDLQTGHIDRVTSHPEYVDPLDYSQDDQWIAILDTRSTTRHMFLSGMRGVPPITDIVTSSINSGVRNNGLRRFFTPWLLYKYGDQDQYGYYGQRINGDRDGIPGSGDPDDPEWNAMADPKWSRDGTMIAYWQFQTITPACGGDNPLPCYPSTAQGGRTYRVMVAKLTSREPMDNLGPADEASDVVPWGTPYTPGDPPVPPYRVPAGEYVLKGKASGFVEVSLSDEAQTGARTVAVTYENYSDDGKRFINGWENATGLSITGLVRKVEWHADMIQTGEDGYLATKKTSDEGFNIQLDIMINDLDINGTMITTINGVEYAPPQTGT